MSPNVLGGEHHKTRPWRHHIDRSFGSFESFRAHFPGRHPTQLKAAGEGCRCSWPGNLLVSATSYIRGGIVPSLTFFNLGSIIPAAVLVRRLGARLLPAPIQNRTG